MGGAPCYHETRIMDTQCMLRSDSNIRIEQTSHHTNIPTNRTARSSTGRHPRDEKAECTSIQRTQEGSIQTQCLVQGPALSFGRWSIHSKGSSHHQLGPGTRLNTSPTLSCRFATVDGNSSRADLRNVKRSCRGHKHLHQSTSGEEVCTAIVSHPLR